MVGSPGIDRQWTGRCCVSERPRSRRGEPFFREPAVEEDMVEDKARGCLSNQEEWRVRGTLRDRVRSRACVEMIVSRWDTRALRGSAVYPGEICYPHWTLRCRS